MQISEFSAWLRTQTNKHKRPFQEETIRGYVETARALGNDSWDVAHALAGLGRCAAAVGHTTQAESLLRQALEILQRTGAAEAPDLLAEIGTLTGPHPTR